MVKDLPAKSEDPGVPWVRSLGREEGGGNGNRLQHSCLENPTDRGTWRASFHGDSKSQTRLRYDFVDPTTLSQDEKNTDVTQGMQNCSVYPKSN